MLKYLLMGISSNFGNMFSMAGAVLFLPFLPMLFCQGGPGQVVPGDRRGLATCEGHLGHLGITAPSRSTLAYVNEYRPWILYKTVFC